MIDERVYFTMAKDAWGDGPWRDEPDKIQFVDEATGLPCLVKRNYSGALCGYVGVPLGHPLFGASYDAPEGDVHGGLTYADTCEEGDEETAICHVPAPGEPDHVWWFGFDCAHGWDLVPRYAADPSFPNAFSDGTYKTVDYVRAECVKLAAQLARESEAKA